LNFYVQGGAKKVIPYSNGTHLASSTQKVPHHIKTAWSASSVLTHKRWHSIGKPATVNPNIG